MIGGDKEIKCVCMVGYASSSFVCELFKGCIGIPSE